MHACEQNTAQPSSARLMSASFIPASTNARRAATSLFSVAARCHGGSGLRHRIQRISLMGASVLSRKSIRGQRFPAKLSATAPRAMIVAVPPAAYALAHVGAVLRVAAWRAHVVDLPGFVSNRPFAVLREERFRAPCAENHSVLSCHAFTLRIPQHCLAVRAGWRFAGHPALRIVHEILAAPAANVFS